MKLRRSRFATLLSLAALALVAGLIPASGVLAQAPSPTVYNIELIVFRNQSGAGGPEDWGIKPTPRGPDQADSPVTGRFVGAVPAAQYASLPIMSSGARYEPAGRPARNAATARRSAELNVAP